MHTKDNVCLAMLDAAVTMFKDPSLVTAGALARDAHGAEVSTLDPSATCFCALGHVAKNLGIDTKDTYDVVNVVAVATGKDAAKEIFRANDSSRTGDKLGGARKMEEILSGATC